MKRYCAKGVNGDNVDCWHGQQEPKTNMSLLLQKGVCLLIQKTEGLLTLCGMHDLESKPVLLCACNDNTVRAYDLPSFMERGKIFAKQEIRSIQGGPNLFFTGDGTGEVRVWKWRARSSNEDLTQKISHLIFVTNFPDSVGKRFAFVRFIKVINLDRLVENLCTLWIGSHHLFANHVRFDRPPKPLVTKADFPPLNEAHKPHGIGINQFGSQKVNGPAGSFVSAVNGVANPLISPSPALVLDDGVILADEGFEDVKLYYLGGRWVMFECIKIEAKRNLMKHTGICSWFHEIQEVSQDFVSDEHVVWVDIEGILLHA
ncbi:RNA-directed DNA polymerase, eukaryota, nucleotide-binding alpha-beta plait domain protein [Tanacetum coccineum]